jgi:hypothetical protein
MKSTRPEDAAIEAALAETMAKARTRTLGLKRRAGAVYYTPADGPNLDDYTKAKRAERRKASAP